MAMGPPPPTPTWGNVIADGRDYLREAPWICLFPGAAISATVLGLNEREVARVGVGRGFGEEALVSGSPRNATVRALTPVQLMFEQRTSGNDLRAKVVQRLADTAVDRASGQHGPGEVSPRQAFSAGLSRATLASERSPHDGARAHRRGQ